MDWQNFYLKHIEINLMFYAGLVYIPLEILFPFKKSARIYRKEFWQDSMWLVFNELSVKFSSAFFSKLFLILLIPLVSHHIISDREILGFKRIPLTNELGIGLMLFFSRDFLSWFAHYGAHKFNVLWRNHILHHSSEQLDCLAGFRSHFLDTLFLDSLPYLPLFFFSVPVHWIYIIGFMEVNVPYFIHSNIDFPRWKIFNFFVHPHFHHWHHAKMKQFPYGQNFGFYTTTFDRVFGTYYNPEEAPENYGIKDKTYPKGFIDRLLYPLNWRKYRVKEESGLSPGPGISQSAGDLKASPDLQKAS